MALSSRRWGCGAELLLLFTSFLALHLPLLPCPTLLVEAQQTRTFYIGAVELDWDYAPEKRNMCKNAPLSPEEDLFVSPAPGLRIGSVYTKIVYRAFTDDSFETMVEQPPQWRHLGLVGPVIHLEEGDTAEIIFKNKARERVSIKPMGLTPITPDKDAQELAVPRSVRSGDKARYLWRADSIAAPSGDSSASSMMWLYRPARRLAQWTNLGLVGPIIVTKKGMANPDGTPRDVDVEFVTLFLIQDENSSPLFDLNVRRVQSNASPLEPGLQPLIPAISDLKALADDGDFQESNLKHTINGYLYCNVPDLKTVNGQRVRWYVASVGSETDLHTPHWHANTALISGERKDEHELIAGSVWTADMTVDTPGTWLYHCHVNDHLKAGMMALYTVEESKDKKALPALTGKEREYFVAAEEVEWDYLPSEDKKINPCTGEEFLPEEAIFVSPGAYALGSVYTKARFVEYTGPDFKERKERTKDEEHMGLLGPLLRAAVGDTLVVHFRNNLNRNASMHPHGVFYNKTHEGAHYNPAGWDGIVSPNKTHIYRWEVPERAGPGPNDPASIVWLYHSHVDEIADTNAGLVGLIAVVDPKRATEDLRPKEYEKEFFAFFTVLDEVASSYATENVQKHLSGYRGIDAMQGLMASPLFAESMLKHAINGYLFCSGPSFALSSSERSLWHLVSLGNEVDVHTPHWDGRTVIASGKRVSTVALMASSMLNVEMGPQKPGNLSLSCQVQDHNLGGMIAPVVISEGNGSTPASDSKTEAPAAKALAATADLPVLTYFIAAEEIQHDYTPGRGLDGCTLEKLEDNEKAALYTVRTDTTIGSLYKKAVYRQYEDEDFTKRTKRKGEEKYLGILGPIVRVAVGQKVKVVFKNLLEESEAGIFPSALQVLAEDGSVLSSSDPSLAVKPNEKATFTWYASPETAALGEADLSSAAFLYQSPVDTVVSTSAGLMGPIVVTRADQLKDNDATNPFPAGIESEHVLLFSVFDENISPYLDYNMEKYLDRSFFRKYRERRNRLESSEERANRLTVLKNEEDFLESNQKHNINGFLYCTMPTIEVQKNNQISRWHLLSVGTENGLHTPNMPGIVLGQGRQRKSTTVELLPGTSTTVDVLTAPETPAASYVLKCDVADHLEAGMKTRVDVSAAFSVSPASLSVYLLSFLLSSLLLGLFMA